MPLEVPVENAAKTKPENAKPKNAKVIEVATAGSSFQCFALIPDPTQHNAAPGVVVWVPEPGEVDRVIFVKQWQKACTARNLILLVPQSLKADRWQLEESQQIVGAIEMLAQRVQLNSVRITIGGSGTGAAMASLVASQRRDLIHGLVLFNAGIPNRVAKLETAPSQPLMVLLAATPTFEDKDAYAQTVARLHLAKLPLAIEKQETAEIEDWIEIITRWSASVDRL